VGAPVVVNGAMIQCVACPAPGVLTVLPTGQVMAGNQPVATIQDAKPMVNIKPFGPCALTPLPPSPSGGPCVPKTTVWTPGSPITTIGGQPIVTQTSQCMCASGGVIMVVNTPAMTTMA
jgi:hypothetical protein